MLDIFFLIAGLYMIFEKKVRISSKKSIEGTIAQKIGLIFLIPALLSYAVKIIPRNPLSTIFAYASLAGYAVAIISIFYFIFFYKITNKDTHQILGKININTNKLKPSPQESKHLFCHNCGVSVVGEGAFCTSCGTKLKN